MLPRGRPLALRCTCGDGEVGRTSSQPIPPRTRIHHCPTACIARAHYSSHYCTPPAGPTDRNQPSPEFRPKTAGFRHTTINFMLTTRSINSNAAGPVLFATSSTCVREYAKFSQDIDNYSRRMLNIHTSRVLCEGYWLSWIATDYTVIMACSLYNNGAVSCRILTRPSAGRTDSLSTQNSVAAAPAAYGTSIISLTFSIKFIALV